MILSKVIMLYYIYNICNIILFDNDFVAHDSDK